MTRDWEATFREWSKPSSETEEQKYKNAERMIGDAIRESATLGGKDIRVFAKGSYRNNTNVRQESDVDVVVVCREPFYADFNFADYGGDALGLTDSPYGYAQLKNDAEAALVTKFGRSGVVSGNKALEIHANSYRVDADVVACFELRRYHKQSLFGSVRFPYAVGTRFYSDSSEQIDNWPDQQYENGVGKNNATGNRYKFIVRALKRLRNEMAEHNILAAKPIPSYLIECVVYNAPNTCFGHSRYSDDMRAVIGSVWRGTQTDDACEEWGEVNEMKYLFWPRQPWTRAVTHAFLEAAWGYVEFTG